MKYVLLYLLIVLSMILAMIIKAISEEPQREKYAELTITNQVDSYFTALENPENSSRIETIKIKNNAHTVFIENMKSLPEERIQYWKTELKRADSLFKLTIKEMKP